MALTLWQRIRVAYRGWSRRRDEEAKRREADFLRRNVTWGTAPPPSPPPPSQPPRTPSSSALDMNGLQVAYLDDSGQIAYYLERESGEVVEGREANVRAAMDRQPTLFHRVPSRSPQSDAEDRSAFVQSLEASPAREALHAASGDAAQFRRILATDRALERAWYNFKNDRATAAIESWLRQLGLR